MSNLVFLFSIIIIVTLCFAIFYVFASIINNINNNDKIIKAYVINLDYRKDRLVKFNQSYNLKNINYERLDAVNKDNLNSKQLHTNKVLGDYGYKSLYKNIREFQHQFNTLGAVACYMSHIKTWNKILSDNVKYGLIFEDDVLFNSDITSELIFEYINKIPKDWDILLLNKNRVTMKNIYDNVNKVDKFICLHSYVINRNCINRLLQDVLPINQQIDFKLSCLASNGKLNVYLVNDKTNKNFYRQFYSPTNIQTTIMKNASWELNCNI